MASQLKSHSQEHAATQNALSNIHPTQQVTIHSLFIGSVKTHIESTALNTNQMPFFPKKRWINL